MNPSRSRGVPGAGLPRGTSRSPMIRPTTPIGTFIRNSHGHVHHAKTKPPNTGPNAGARETTIPRIDIARPSLSGPTACPRMVCPAGIKTPADRPCATRRTMSSSIFHAIAHRPEVTVKTDNAMSHKRPGPNVWLSHAHDGNETASASKYPLETHWTRSRLESRSVAMVSRPIFASEASIPAAKAPNRSEEHTSELQSRGHLVCRLLLEKKKTNNSHKTIDDQQLKEK